MKGLTSTMMRGPSGVGEATEAVTRALALLSAIAVVLVAANLTFGQKLGGGTLSSRSNLRSASLAAVTRAEDGGWAESPRLYQTYSGSIFLSFKNYDIRLGDVPMGDYLAQTGGRTTTPYVIYKNPNGMHWDGYHFLHPAYPYRMVTRNIYAFNVIGAAPGTQWPLEEVDREFRWMKPSYRRPEAAPVIAYRPLPSAEAPSPVVGPIHVGAAPQLVPKPYLIPPQIKLKLGDDGRLHYVAERPLPPTNPMLR